MKKIGLLSDTHSYLHPKVFEHFRSCDEIWHAGDIGNASIIDKLANFKPTLINLALNLQMKLKFMEN